MEATTIMMLTYGCLVLWLACGPARTPEPAPPCPSVKLSPKVTVPLPAPVMADGLAAAQQQEVIEKLPGRQTPVEELTRLSTVAPYVLKIRDIESGDPEAPGRGLSLFFVAQGSFEELSRSDFLDRLLNSGRKDAEIRPLPRGDASDAAAASAHVAVPLMERVLLSGTVKTRWTRTAESITVFGQLDSGASVPPEQAGQWRKLRRGDDGKVGPAGPPQPYEAAAYVLKITRLQEPAGALFVEWHLLYSEPTAWFDGANLLRSKLPLVLQTKVRGFRRELVRGGQDP